MTTNPLDGRVARLRDHVAELEAEPHPPILLMGDAERYRDDPRLPALLAAAQTEGRMIIRPWSETPDGELVDHSATAHVRAKTLRCDTEAAPESAFE